MCLQQACNIKVSGIYPGPMKSLLLKPNLETICIIHVAHRDTQYIMETLSERCSHVTHISGVNGRSRARGGRCAEGRRKDAEKMSADECEGNRPLALAFIARALFTPFLFLTLSPLFPPLSPPLLTALLLPVTLHSFLAPFLPMSLLQIPLFIPSSLCLA